MAILGILVLVIFSISAALLILLVLIQDEQGEGLGGIFGGGSSTSLGSRSGNILTRFTSIIGTIFIICCVVFALLKRPDITGSDSSTQQQRVFKDWPVEEINNDQTPDEPALGPAPDATPAE